MVDERGVDDIRDHGAKCNGVDSDAAAIQASIATGARRIFLPANTLWIPERNYVPGNCQYIGEDWQTTIIKAANPENEYIVVGPYTELYNVAIFDQVEPGIKGFGCKSPRPVRQYQNLCSGDQIPTHYAWTGTMMTVSGEGQDLCALTINGGGVGDLVFIGPDGSATGLHFYVNGMDVQKSGTGILIDVFGKGPGIHLIGRKECSSTYALQRIQQLGNGPSLMLDPGVPTEEDLVFTLGHKTAGRVLHVYQHTSTYDGTPLFLNMGRGGGTYTGKPIRYRNGEGVEPFVVNNDGSIESEQMTAFERRLAELEAKVSER